MRFGRLGAGFGKLGSSGGGGSVIIPGIISAGVGSYLWSGDDMTPAVSHVLGASGGSYAFSGQDASFLRSRVVGASGGSYTYTGQDATLTKATGFTPASLSPIGWWEASSSSLFQSNAGTTAATANNDVVGYWADKSGNGNHLKSVSDNTTRPTLQGVGGNPCIRFDGTNDLLKCAVLNLYNGGACSVFFAAKVNSGGIGLVICAEASSTDTNPMYQIASGLVTSTSMSVRIRKDDGANILAGTTPDLTSALNNTDLVLGMTDSGTLVSEYIDQGSAVTQSETRSGSLTMDQFSVGGLLRTSASAWIAMDLYAMVAVPSVISSGNRAALVTYLGALQGRTI